MSDAPAGNLPSNRMMFALVGIAGGTVVLCGGFFVMALTTAEILKRTAPGILVEGTRPHSTSPGRGTEPINEAAAAGAARAFMEDLRVGKYEQAYARCNTIMQSRETVEEFRKRLSASRALQGFQQIDMRQSSSAANQVDTFRGKVTGPAGTQSYSLTMSLEDEGWRVNEFYVQ